MLHILFILLFVTVTTNGELCVSHNGSRQSPISINNSSALNSFAPRLQWSCGYYSTPQEMYLNNTGHSLTLTVTHTEPLQLHSGILNIPYNFAQLHFHWGEHDGIGSEHVINGFTYPMEMHVVHSQNIKNDIDNLVVVAYFFMVTQTSNPALQGLVDAAISLKDETTLHERVTPFALSQLLPDGFSYFTYNGSLTTPPYTESVTWIVATTVLPISRSQLDVFRDVAKVHTGLKNNYRCPQDINQRSIHFLNM